MTSSPASRAWKGAGISPAKVLIVAVLAIVGLAAGMFLSTRGEDTVSATTPILLNPLDGNPFRPTNRGEQLVNLETEAQAVRSTEVADIVRADTNSSESAKELIEAVSVSVPVNTQILDITYTTVDPDVALRNSQAFAETYLKVRATRANERLDEQTGQIDNQISTLESSLVRATAERSAADSESVQANLLDQEIDSLADQINTLETRRSELAGTSVDPGQVVTNADLAGGGPLSNPLVLPLAGLFGGAMLGLLLILVRSQVDDRVSEPGDLVSTGLEVVGTIGWWPGTMPARPEQLGQLRDEVRRLCVTVLSMEQRRPLSLLISPARPSQVFPRIAAETAMAFARGGFRTLILDTTGQITPDTEDRPFAQHSETDSVGISDVVMGEVSLSEAKVSASSLLDLVGPGRDLAAAMDLFLGEPMARLIKEAKSQCDVLLVVGSSASGSSAQALASAVDATLVEVEPGTHSKRDLEALRRALELLDGSLLGAVFVDEPAAMLSARLDTEVHQRALMPGPLELYQPGQNRPNPFPGGEPPPHHPSPPAPEYQVDPSDTSGSAPDRSPSSS